MGETLDTLAPRARVECVDCPIRHRAVCSRCEEDELATLNAMKSYINFAAGDAIVLAGGEMSFLGSIVTGVATISQSLEDGRRQMVGLLLPSDFIGRPGRQVAQYDITAATDVMVCHFSKRDFENLIKTSPTIGNRLLEMTMDELDAAREWMLILGRKTAREKIASFIAINARRQASLQKASTGKAITFDLPVTREEMSDYLGLTLETVSRQISALKKEGLIELEGLRRITAPDYAALWAETGAEGPAI